MKPVIGWNNEAKTGALVLTGILFFALVWIKINGDSFFSDGYLLKTSFGYSGGIQKYSPVRYLGVDVGEVRGIRVDYSQSPKVELDVWVKSQFKIDQSAKATIATLGLMGEKYLEIQSGPSTGKYLQVGDTLASEDPFRLEELLRLGTHVAKDLSETSRSVNRLAQHLDEVVDNNEDRIENIFSNFESTSVHFKDFSQDIRYHPWKLLIKGKERTPEEMRQKDSVRMAQKTETNFSPAKR